MKNILLILVLLLAGCDGGINVSGPNDAVATVELPTVNLPVSLRQENWLGNRGEGSCVHATLISLFRWQGRYWMANHWRAKYSAGEVADETWNRGSNNLRVKLEHEGIRYAYVTNGDESFLDWACSTRRGCGVTVNGGKHCVALVHFDETWACLMDNNSIDKYIWVEREIFLSEWRASRGWAFAVLYCPSPPL